MNTEHTESIHNEEVNGTNSIHCRIRRLTSHKPTEGSSKRQLAITRNAQICPRQQVLIAFHRNTLNRPKFSNFGRFWILLSQVYQCQITRLDVLTDERPSDATIFC